MQNYHLRRTLSAELKQQAGTPAVSDVTDYSAVKSPKSSADKDR